MEGSGSEKRSVGIDCGKRTYEVKILQEGIKARGFNGKTDSVGLEKLVKYLHKEDVVAIEAGVPAFDIARMLIERVGCEVVVLNAGKLAVIYASLKKTDKQDALKLARLVMRIPREELPEVSLPTKQEEEDRSLVSQQDFMNKQRTKLLNRLHSVFLRAGHTMVVKKDIKDKSSREKTVKCLNGIYGDESQMLCRLLDETEEMLKQLAEKISASLKKNCNTPNVMSLPGVGPMMAMAFLAYVGDGSRFGSMAQVSYYSGLVPRVDCSGDTNRYGSITKRGCRALRRVAIQSAWALIRSKYNGPLRGKYEQVKSRKGSGKAIVAVARKMIELMYILVKNNDYCRDVDEVDREKKLKQYKLINTGKPKVQLRSA